MHRPAVVVGVLVLLFTAAPVIGNAGPSNLLGLKEADMFGFFTAESSAAATGSGNFSSRCAFSHRLADDTIVFPNKPGASHYHDFFGNRSTNAYSTYSSMRSAATTCQRAAETAGYWVPTLLLNGQPVTPTRAIVYYTGQGKNLSQIQAPPADLRVIAGNSKSTTTQPQTVVYWDCGKDGPVGPSSTVPYCSGTNTLRLHIFFPDCWNGTSTDSVDHKSHTAYSKYNDCPSTHPVSLPRLRLHIVYPIRGGSGVSLSSGSAFTAHADFFNTWNQTELERLVRDCIKAGKTCTA